MRQAIETAPQDGKVVLLEDEASDSYAVARWSIEAQSWVEENGRPSEIDPTHWYPMPRDEFPRHEDHEASGSFAAAARRYGFPLFSGLAALRRSIAPGAIASWPAANADPVDAIGAQAEPVEARHPV